jgi:hypothetical protein
MAVQFPDILKELDHTWCKVVYGCVALLGQLGFCVFVSLTWQEIARLREIEKVVKDLETWQESHDSQLCATTSTTTSLKSYNLSVSVKLIEPF